MATSFAAYASQYLNRQQPGSTSLSSSHPMFFSFSTDDGSRGGHGNDTDLDDLDDPHLRESNASTAIHGRRDQTEEDDNDPYLRLDEDELTGRHGFESRIQQQTSPVITANENASVSSDSPKGWLAHLAASPSVQRSRSPSPARSSSSDSVPPPDLFAPVLVSPSSRAHQPPHLQPPPPPRATRLEPPSLSLTESLLPRDGRSRPLDVFSLPDPRHTPRGRRKYNDSTWTALWLAGVTVCVFFSIVLLFVARQPDSRIPRSVLPYTTLLHTVPMLTILTFVSAVVAYVHIFLLRIFVRPVMIATSIFIPVTLLVSAIWAFIGSFMWDGDKIPTWGETVGLRLFAIIPLVLSIYTARRLIHLPQQIHTTSSTLTLVTHLLISNPLLLALSPAILLVALLVSLPFLTLIFRLLLIGYATPPIMRDSRGWEWHVYGWANWAIIGAVAVWLWTWGVARGILRMTTASVIGAWYFADPSLPPPPPASTQTIHSGLFRSTGPSLGTTVLSALLLTLIRILTLVTLFLQRLPFYLPAQMVLIVLPAVRMGVGYLEGITTALSQYALVYAGLTGDPFFASARRARALTGGVESRSSRTHRGRERTRGYGKEPPLTLLTISPLTLTFPFALMTYLFVAHTLGAPDQALGAAVLAGGVTALVGLFCVGLVKDTADTLYLCYCIDKDVGEKRREEVFVIFEPDSPAPSRQHPSSRNHRTSPEGIVPLSPTSSLTGQRPPQPANSDRSTLPKGVLPFIQHKPYLPPHPQTPSISTQSHSIQHVVPHQSQPPSQHRRIPSHPSSRPQFAPSASVQPRTAPLSPPPPLEDEDPDPFKKSLVDDDEDHEVDMRPSQFKRDSLGERGTAPISSSPRSPGAFNSPGRSSFSPRSTSFTPPTSGGARKMQTSTELNMKSHIYESSRRSITSSGSASVGVGSRNFRQYDMDEDVERGMSMVMSGRTDAEGQQNEVEESDLFPGSDFFN